MKKLMKILPVVFVLAMAVTSVFAVGIPKDEELTGGQHGIDKITGLAQNIWVTVRTIVQILAIAAVVFAGLRYMFASADTKADIKKSMGVLAVGALLVFAATTIIGFVVDVANNTLATK